MNPRLFLDRNFAVSMFFIFVIGVTYLASLALMTPYLQTLMGYPIVTAGLVMGPRGVGTMACMFIVGRTDRQGRHARFCCSLGLSLTAWAMYDMTGWTPDVSQWTIVWVGFVQGAGLGFLFVPLTTVDLFDAAAASCAAKAPASTISRAISAPASASRSSRLCHREHAGQSCDDRRLCHARSTTRSMLRLVQHLSPLKAAGRAALDGMITTRRRSSPIWTTSSS